MTRILATLAALGLLSISIAPLAHASSEPRCWYAVKCVDNGEQLNDSRTPDGSARRTGESIAEHADRMEHFTPSHASTRY